MCRGNQVRRHHVQGNIPPGAFELQEAHRRSVSVRDAEIKKAYALLAKQNNVPEDKFAEFLEQLGVPERSLKEQIRAQIAWSKLLQRQLENSIRKRSGDYQGRFRFHPANKWPDSLNKKFSSIRVWLITI